VGSELEERDAMATTRLGRAAVRGYRWGGDPGPSGGVHVLARLAPALLVVLALSGLAAARMTPPARATVPVAAVGGGAPGGTPAELTAAAADLLAAATAKGGTGYRFEIVQRSTLTARQGGPRIEIPDPADRTKSLGTTDAYYLNGLTETGYVTPGGFFMEMRTGPESTDAAVDLAGGELLFRALVRDGTTYRDDGLGWYPTEDPPGIGLDPATAGLLPALLRRAGSAKEADLATAGGELGKDTAAASRAITATGEVADIPGVVAVDGAGFTEITRPVDFAFDAAGRLTGLVVTARNTNVTAHDLVVVTEIRLAYDDVPASLPKAEPRWLDAGKPLVTK
jgi:hypothetical protein